MSSSATIRDDAATAAAAVVVKKRLPRSLAMTSSQSQPQSQPQVLSSRSSNSNSNSSSSSSSSSSGSGQPKSGKFQRRVAMAVVALVVVVGVQVYAVLQHGSLSKMVFGPQWSVVSSQPLSPSPMSLSLSMSTHDVALLDRTQRVLAAFAGGNGSNSSKDEQEMKKDKKKEKRKLDLKKRRRRGGISQHERVERVRQNGRTLIMYSGPTDSRERQPLYHRNLRYFLEHGTAVRRRNQDTSGYKHPEPLGEDVKHAVPWVAVVIVVTREAGVEELLAQYHVDVVYREDRCYDMESFRVGLKRIGRETVDKFDYFVFLNCGMMGPFLPAWVVNTQIHWSSFFTAYLDDRMKLVGSSIGCGGHHGLDRPHLQSMLWVTDRVGLRVILDAKCIYDCGRQVGDRFGKDDHGWLVRRYEMCLSESVEAAGYTYGAINWMQRDLDWSDPRNNKCLEIYYKRPQYFHQRNPHPLDVMFYKMTRTMDYSPVLNQAMLSNPEVRRSDDFYWWYGFRTQRTAAKTRRPPKRDKSPKK